MIILRTNKIGSLGFFYLTAISPFPSAASLQFIALQVFTIIVLRLTSSLTVTTLLVSVSFLWTESMARVTPRISMERLLIAGGLC
jgi:hypothetical protein